MSAATFAPDARVRVTDPDYLAWCRQRPCYFHQQERGVLVFAEPHHTVLKGMGGAQERDDYAIPVCRECHDRCHRVRRPFIDVEEQLAAAKTCRGRYLALLTGEQASALLVPL